jgi:hypothetical protein
MYADKHIGHLVLSKYMLKHHFFPEKYAYKHICAYLPTPGPFGFSLVLSDVTHRIAFNTTRTRLVT